MIGAGLDRVWVFNLRDLRMHPIRALTSFGVVAVSATLLVAVIAISGSITGSVDKLASSIAGDAQLEVSGITDSGFDQSLAPAIARSPGVRAAVPMVRTTIEVASERTLLIGVDQRITELHSDLQRVVQSHLAGGSKLIAAPNGVVVGAGLGRPEGESFDIGAVRVTIAAVIDGEVAHELNDGHFMITTISLAQQISNRSEQLDSVLVAPEHGSDLAQVRSDIGDIVTGRAVVADPSFRAAQTSSGIAILRYTTLMAAAVSLVVAAFLVYTAMNMAISQRRTVISTLRAIGGRGPAIVRDLLAEAAALGLLGSIVGAGIGTLVGRIAIGTLPPAVVHSVEARTVFVLPPVAVPIAVGACVAASIAAAAVATRNVYEVEPIEALTPIRASGAESDNGWLRTIAALAALAATAAAVVIAPADVGRNSIIAVALVLVAAVCLCFAISGTIIRSAALVAGVFGGPGALGATSIQRSPRRVWATSMTVTIAVAMIVSITGSNKNGLDSTVNYFGSLARSDIWVSSQPADVIATAPIMPQRIDDAVASVPGVANVVPGQIAFATVRGTRVMLQGFARGTNQSLFNAVNQDLRAQIDAGEGVAVSRDLSRTLNVSAGGELELPTPHGIRRVKVLEVVPYFSGLAGAVAIGLQQLREWFDRPGSTYLEVRVSPGADRDDVEASIRHAVQTDVYVFSGEALVEGVSGAVKQAIGLTTAIMWIVGFVAAIALWNTLTLSVLERRRELGVLRAMGCTRRFLLLIVLTEATGIGMVGTVLGLAIGAATQYLNSIAFSNAIGLDVVYRAGPLTFVFAALALALNLLGSIPPAVRAARLNVVDAIEIE